MQKITSFLIVRFVMAVLLLSATTATIVEAKVNHVPKVPATASLNSSPVFFITNRQQNSGKYLAERSETLEYGSVRSEQASASKSSPLAINQDQFFSQLKHAQAQTGNKGVLVFVHGYDCSFEKALKLGNKLSESSGVPVIVFSWPSRSKALTYAVDECTAEWSAVHFNQAMYLLSQQVGSGNISLVAHSLGCRLVSWALQSEKLDKATFKHILFCSPDIDTGIFKNTLRAIVDASKYVAVFASRRDFRLELSRFIHGNDRLGYISGDLQKNQGVHFIDLSDIDRSLFGHRIPYAQIAGIISSDHAQLADNKI